MLQRFLDPATLASISSLDLVAKTVVDGFVAGLHRAPDLGFSQQFPEYRAQSEGDHLRHIGRNVIPRTDTDFTKPFIHFQNFLHRRGIVVVISDFYENPEVIVQTVEPLRYRGNEVILFHMLDPQEIKPKFREPVLLVDMEHVTEALEV